MLPFIALPRWYEVGTSVHVQCAKVKREVALRGRAKRPNPTILIQLTFRIICASLKVNTVLD